MTPVFDLPDRLAAKAAPHLIRRDEEQLEAIAARIAAMVAELEEQVAALRELDIRLPPGMPGHEALDRDLEIHRMTARVRVLQRFGRDVCLGRVVPVAGDPVYVGRLGLRAADGTQLLTDWRSPAAEPFFGATHAEPMGLLSRRRYRWTGDRITDYWDEVFTPEGLRSTAALDDQSAFIASLGSARSPRMRDVLATIQADQDAIIRAGSHGVLVVDGGPGTGKTVVALHRAAYLLYSDPRLDRRRGGVLVVGPSQPYLSYVADVLPSLGEEGVQLCTLRELLPEGVSAARETDRDVARLKSTVDWGRAIETAVRFYEQPPTDGMDADTETVAVRVTTTDWADAFRAVAPGTPHNEAREQVWEELLAILVDKADAEEPAELCAGLERNGDLRAALHTAWPLIDATDLVSDLWSVPAYLAHCAPWLSASDVARLQRPAGSAWTVEDLPLLDMARHRLGDPGAVRRKRRAEAVARAERRVMSGVVDDLIRADDDGEGVLTMLGGEDLHNALLDDIEGGRDEVRALDGPFAHVIVDEAQELTDAEWQVLLARCPSRSFTVVGDRAQARQGFTETWEERLGRIGLGDVRVRSLTVNYRTPAEVMAVAEPVIREVLPDANVPTSVRESGVPVTTVTRSSLRSLLDDWLATHPEGVASVIGPEGSEGLGGLVGLGAFDGEPRVQSLTPELCKGLEFDLVLLVGEQGDGIEGAVDRYVALTRATQQLVLVGS